jgi:hypothetical protein
MQAVNSLQVVSFNNIAAASDDVNDVTLRGLQ